MKVSTEALLDIDKDIDQLVRQIELLSYVNPINIEEEKGKFFSSKYQYIPDFKYPEINFDKFKLHRELFDQPIELIENLEIRKLYEDIIYTYSGLIQCIETIGSGKKFYYNCLHCFGTPTEKDVENAKFILHFNDEDPSEERFTPKFNSKETEVFFKDFSKDYDFNYEIVHSKKISASAMVLNNIKTLVLNDHHKFSTHELNVLNNHEIGVLEFIW